MGDRENQADCVDSNSKPIAESLERKLATLPALPRCENAGMDEVRYHLYLAEARWQ
jgi:hypothetical protein